MGKIAAIATIKAQEGKEAELEEAFKSMVAYTANEPGTLVYALMKKDGEPGTFVFFELYESEDALKAHSTSDNMKAMGPTLGALLAGRPDLARFEPVAAKGIDV
jgi:quinol monooxygenase YgiN